jgi:hypothetical protein
LGGASTLAFAGIGSTGKVLIGPNFVDGVPNDRASRLNYVGIPTSSAGLLNGTFWNNSVVLNIVPSQR